MFHIKNSASASGAVVKERKSKHFCLKWLGIFFLIFIGLFFLIFLVFLVGAILPSKEDQNNFIGAIGVFSVGALLLWGIIKLMKRIKLLNQYFFPHRLLSWLSGAAVFILLILYSFYTYNDLSYIHSVRILPLIQDSLSEAAAVKIMGDSIVVGHPAPGASFARVRTSAEAVSKRLSALSVPGMLVDYKQAAVDWSDKIAVAAKNPGMWKYLAGQLEDFHLTLSDGQAKELFTTSVKNIQTLKEFGDTAIKNKNRETMLYIAAKLLVQKHWLKGIIYSENKFLALNSIPSALASNGNPLEVPAIGDVVAISCQQTCAWINEGKRTAADKQFLWNLYRCNHCKKLTAIQQPGGQGQQMPPTQQTPNQGQGSQSPQPENKSSADRNAPYSYANNPPRRELCVGGIKGQSGAYCAENVAQMVNEIESSAIDLVEGKISSQDAWVESWANFTPLEETEGVTTGKNVLTAEHSPTVQTFYNNCKGKGGIVGGTGKVMVGVPTTESGYRCEYKTDSPNFGKGVSCWDFLTYSGGRYMGGNKGCQEKNLVPPAPASEPAPVKPTLIPVKKATSAPVKKSIPSPSINHPAATTNVWDGNYNGPAQAICSDGSPSGFYSDSLDVAVQNNKLVWETVAGVPYTGSGEINANGYAQVHLQDNPYTYQFYRSNGKAFVSINIIFNFPALFGKPAFYCQHTATAARIDE